MKTGNSGRGVPGSTSKGVLALLNIPTQCCSCVTDLTYYPNVFDPKAIMRNVSSFSFNFKLLFVLVIYLYLYYFTSITLSFCCWDIFNILWFSISVFSSVTLALLPQTQGNIWLFDDSVLITQKTSGMSHSPLWNLCIKYIFGKLYIGTFGGF